MLFEWDPDKAKTNQQKHGVSFVEASTVFDDPFSTTFPDPYHSQVEDRYLTIGVSAAQTVLVIAHTDRDD